MTTRNRFLLCTTAALALAIVGRAPEAHAGPAQIELHFRCSPWLYLSEVTGAMRNTFSNSRGTTIAMDIAAVNARLCAQTATSLTFAANTVFSSINGIPVAFTATTEVLPGGGMAAAGLKYRVALLNNGASDFATDLINERTPVPDIVVNAVDIARDVDTSTCNPWQAGSADCESLVVATCPTVVTSPFILCQNAARGSVFGRPSPFIQKYDVRSINDVDSWSASTAIGGPRKINVTVRAVAANDLQAITHGLYVRASTYLYTAGVGFAVKPLTPTTYLPTVGVVTVIAGPSDAFNVTAMTHELGHVFGAMHDRASMQAQAPEFYAAAGLAEAYQFAHVHNGNERYDTNMVPVDSVTHRLNFSTTTFWKSPPIICKSGPCPSSAKIVIGDAATDNRRYILETLQWILGDPSLALATPTNPTDNTIDKVLAP